MDLQLQGKNDRVSEIMWRCCLCIAISWWPSSDESFSVLKNVQRIAVLVNIIDCKGQLKATVYLFEETLSKN